MTTNRWTPVQSYGAYHDYDKELCALPDKGNTSVDLRLTFDTGFKDCYFTVSLHNDDGDTKDWEKAHDIPWAVGVAMLRADGVEIPNELTKGETS
jgi:hypothetical protein